MGTAYGLAIDKVLAMDSRIWSAIIVVWNKQNAQKERDAQAQDGPDTEGRVTMINDPEWQPENDG